MNMLRTVKQFCWITLLALIAPMSWGFTLMGPVGNNSDFWQTPIIGYDIGDDLGAPKIVGEGYRRNVPIIYYSYDAQFLNFFAPNQGDLAVDSAFTIMNRTMTNNPTGITRGLDGYSPSLSEFPQESMHINFLAQSLFLTDLKSVTLNVLMEQMELFQPERFTWTLGGRFLPPGGQCPQDELYLVTQRNYDDLGNPSKVPLASPYVNGTLYSYFIAEFCTGPNPLAITVPFSPDPNADIYTSVAGRGLVFNGGWYS